MALLFGKELTLYQKTKIWICPNCGSNGQFLIERVENMVKDENAPVWGNKKSSKKDLFRSVGEGKKLNV